MRASAELSVAAAATTAAILVVAAAATGRVGWHIAWFAFSAAYFSGRAAWLAVRIERMRGEQ